MTERTSWWSLARASLLCVAIAAGMGWAASFVGLHDYGMTSMRGFDTYTAWLVPGAFDGAAFGCCLITYRASINGRVSVVGRLLMWVFTAVSAGINYIHQPSSGWAQWVACALPAAAVAVFDVVLIELRADFEARHGRKAFRLRIWLLLLRWVVDRAGTVDAFRAQIKAIPVTTLAGVAELAAADPVAEPDRPTVQPAPPRRRRAPKPTAAAEPAEAEPEPPAEEGTDGDADTLDALYADPELLAEFPPKRAAALTFLIRHYNETGEELSANEVDRKLFGKVTKTTQQALKQYMERYGRLGGHLSTNQNDHGR